MPSYKSFDSSPKTHTLAGYTWSERFNVYSMRLGDLIPCSIAWEDGGYKLEVAGFRFKKSFKTPEEAAQSAITFITNRLKFLFD